MTREKIKHRFNLAMLAVEALTNRGLRAEMSSQALSQLESIQEQKIEIKGNIRDQRQLLWCSIDNDDSMDLDQLTVCFNDEKEQMHILVAIADVDALVKKNSAIDEQARANTTSVYTSARIFPMLPEKLSHGLTSLNPGVDRMALVCEMTFDAQGLLTNSDIYQSCVHNHCKLAYDSVSDWLEGTGPLPFAALNVPGITDQLQMQDALAQKLKKLRHLKGSLEFETFQPMAKFEGEEVTSLVLQPHNRARQLIEEFMIAANGCTSRFLAAHQGASLRRVVRSPEKWMRIVDLAHRYGVTLPLAPDSKALEQFLADQHRKDPLRFPDLSLIVVKLMGRGEYIVERHDQQAIGHFGLAVKDYTHSTAPNRRYPDLITLRQIKAILNHEPSPYTLNELEDLALHCSRQEDAAQKVERQMRKSDAAMLLYSRVGQYFDGLITGVNEKGSWVRIFTPPAEGRLIGALPPIRVGQKVRVKLTSTNVEKGFIDFALTHE
jgi:exoribonuclease-2